MHHKCHGNEPKSHPSSRPFAYNDNTTSSTSPKRRCRFFTIAGLNVPCRSRGTAISTSPTASESTVFDRQPLPIFAEARSRPAPFFSYPRCSVICSFNAVSSTFFVNSFNSPSGPVKAKPCSRAWAIIAAAATCSGDDCRPTFLIFAHEFTASDVITHSAHPAGPHPGVSGRKHRSLHSPRSVPTAVAGLRHGGPDRWGSEQGETTLGDPGRDIGVGLPPCSEERGG